MIAKFVEGNGKSDSGSIMENEGWNDLYRLMDKQMDRCGDPRQHASCRPASHHAVDLNDPRRQEALNDMMADWV